MREKGREGSFLFPMNKGVPVGDGFRVAVGVKSKGENRARGGALEEEAESRGDYEDGRNLFGS